MLKWMCIIVGLGMLACEGPGYPPMTPDWLIEQGHQLPPTKAPAKKAVEKPAAPVAPTPAPPLPPGAGPAEPPPADAD